MLVLLSLAYAQDAVTLLSDGTWVDPEAFPEAEADGLRYRDFNFWVDISVENWDPNKSVGIRWTDDNWVTWQDADAWYELNVATETEQWGIDLMPLGTLTNDGAWSTWTNYLGGSQDIRATTLTVEYAVWATMNGTTYWDNNGGANYVQQIHRPEYAVDGTSLGAVLEWEGGGIWTRCPVRLKAGSADATSGCTRGETGTWARADLVCRNLTYRNRTEWRLPTEAELGTFATLAQQVPDLFDEFFPDGLATDRYFWTSTAGSPARVRALSVLMGPGGAEDGAASSMLKSGSAYAWCVEG